MNNYVINCRIDIKISLFDRSVTETNKMQFLKDIYSQSSFLKMDTILGNQNYQTQPNSDLYEQQNTSWISYGKRMVNFLDGSLFD